MGQARGLQQGAGLRRQQDPQAGVPRGRRAGQGVRHAGLDRRRAVQPHAPGRRRGGPPRAQRGARPGELGRLARRDVRPRRQHRAEPDHGGRRPAGTEGFGIGFKRSWEEALAGVEAAGGTPYAIPAGASDHELGGLGFAGWAAEVAEQEAELGVFFDTIIVCSVTGSTQAGMIAGFAAQERPRRIIGIDGSARPAETHDAGVADRPPHRRADRGERELRDDEIILDDRWHAGTYGLPDAKTIEAIRLAAGSRACSPTRSTRGSRWPR